MRDMIDYAADHGVRVVPEFDARHARSWLKAYPQLGRASSRRRARRHE